MKTFRTSFLVILLSSLLFGVGFFTQHNSVYASENAAQIMPTVVTGWATFYGPNQTDFTLSVEELKLVNEKINIAQQHWNNKHSGGMSPNTTGSKQLNVGASGAYREPNLDNHVNYCAPSSSQVAIKAHGYSVPNLETLATQEGVAPNDTPVWIGNTQPVLNSDLNTSWYVVSSSSGSGQFGTWLEQDIDNNFSMLTGLYTQGVSGWNVWANHIVATYGYNESGGVIYVYYVDTASNKAGYYGNYFNSPTVTSFYPHVTANGNNGQVW